MDRGVCALNKITVKNRFTIPIIDDILGRLKGEWYHQVRIQLEDIHKTMFFTSFGLYEFLVMPLRLTNAQVAFNRMMERIFCDHQAFVGTFFDHDCLLEEQGGAQEASCYRLCRAQEA